MGDTSNDLTWSSSPLKAVPLIHYKALFCLGVRVTRIGDEETV